MIKEVTMYTIVCDSCGCDVNADADYSCWNEETYVEDIRQEAGWEKVDKKHYCTDCFEYDENDELIIKKK
jgi:uncharacterized protein YbdZ (MbtH family)